MIDLLEEFRAILAALDSAGVEYAVCGGLAVAIHARPRATVDVDLLVPGQEIEGAKQAVRGLGYTIEADPMTLQEGAVRIHRLSKPDPDTGDLLGVDFILVTPALAKAWETRERVAWEHGEVPVVSRAGLVLMKRLRGSGLDLDDIRLLEGDDGES